MLTLLSTHRLTAIGLGLIIIVFIISGSISILEISKLQNISKQILTLRVPTTAINSAMISLIHNTQGSLRGWLLLEEEYFDNELRESWVKIRTNEEKIKELSKRWTNPKNQDHFAIIQSQLNEFEKIQFKILEISSLPENNLANQILATKAVPLVLLINDKITHLIDHEESKEMSQERKNYILALTQFRNSLGLSKGNIRSYSSTGNKDFIADYEKSWANNQQYFDDLKKLQPIFDTYQERIFNDIVKRREEFSKILNQIFELRTNDGWNQAKFLLKTKAAPLSQEIINTLEVMTDNQHHLLLVDNETVAISTYNFKNNLFIIILLAIIFALWLGMIICRRSSIAQELIESRAQLIDQNIMIAYLDDKGIIKDISNSLCRVLNAVKTDFIGKQSYFFLHKKDRESFFNEIFMLVQTGEIWEGEIEMITNDGHKIWLYSKLIPTLKDNNSEEGYTNILYNITDKKHLEAISITDKLTSLFNRRHFDVVIVQQLKLARRNGGTITLCILDIDYFKEYNDHYGHQAGDNALKQVAHSIQQNLKRPSDFVFRLGGEEFGIIFNGLGAPNIAEILNKIKDDIESLLIKHEYSKAHKYLTISIGAKINSSIKNLDVDDFYLAADKALYEAKKKRNCVVIELNKST